jgi:hypothetical protein
VRLYHNEGHGHFRDVTSEAGLASSDGKCLGLVLADLDGDGWPDIFVANDSVQNFFYINQRNASARPDFDPASASATTGSQRRGWAPTRPMWMATSGPTSTSHISMTN